MEQQDNNQNSVKVDNVNTKTDSKKRSPLMKAVIGFFAVIGVVSVVGGVAGCSAGAHHWKSFNVADKANFISERIIDSVDADEQQSVQIKAIMQDYAPKILTMKDSYKHSRDAIIDVLGQPEVTISDVEAVRAIAFEQLNQDSIELSNMIAEVASVLTQAQRQEVLSKMNKHHYRY